MQHLSAGIEFNKVWLSFDRCISQFSCIFDLNTTQHEVGVTRHVISEKNSTDDGFLDKNSV